jgi:hypothetical protein
VTYFNLRKRDPEPEPDEDIEVEDEAAEEEPAAPTGVGGALKAGICGPGAWITARFGPGTSWAVHVGSVWAVGYYRGWVSVALPVAWLLAFAAFVPREQMERAAAWIERRAAGRPPAGAESEPAEEAPVDPLVTVLWALISDAPGVHVKTLAEHLQAAAPGEVVDRAAVRAKLAARGIPTRASVRAVDGRVNEGVHRVDLQAWQEALPDPSPRPAPEARSGPVATAVTCDVGDVPTPVATPLSRLRGLLSRGAA